MSLDKLSANQESKENNEQSPLDEGITEDKAEAKEDDQDDKSKDQPPVIADISNDVTNEIKKAAAIERKIKQFDDQDQGQDEDEPVAYQEREHQTYNGFGLVYVLVGAAILGGAYALYRKRKPIEIITNGYQAPTEIDGEYFGVQS